MISLIPTILSIIDNGIKLWDKGRMLSFKKKYHRLLEDLKEAENKQFPEYTDADIDLIEEKLETFIKVYDKELKAEVIAKESK